MGFQMDNPANGYEECGEEPVLPRDIFSNRFSYYIVTNKITSGFIFCEILFVAAFILFNRHNDVALLLILIFGLLLTFYTMFWALYIYAQETTYLKEQYELALLKEVATVRPGMDMKKWDFVASKLNSVMANNPSSTLYFFYDGDACVDYFKKRFLEPYSERKQQRSVGLEQADANDEQGVPTNFNQLDPFIEEAVNIYQESMKTFWSEGSGESSPD